jgi:hypothetical protein
MTETEASILAEAGGDVYLALAMACDRLDWTMPRISAGYVRADTSKVKRAPKPVPPAITDEWIETSERPE